MIAPCCSPLPRLWRRLPSSRENSTAKQSQLVENLLKNCQHNLLKTTCWKSVETANEPVLKTIWKPVETANVVCWISVGPEKTGWKRGDNWDRVENRHQHQLKTCRLENLLQSHTRVTSHISKKKAKPSSSLLVLFLVGAIYLSIDQENMKGSEKEICRGRKKKYVEEEEEIWR